jgi:hypothetical protein
MRMKQTFRPATGLRFGSDERRRSISLLCLAIFSAAALGALVPFAHITGAEIPIVCTLAIVVLCLLVLDRSAVALPGILRPAPVVFGSMALGAVAATSLADHEISSYFGLLAFEMVGFVLALILIPDISTLAVRPVVVDRVRLIRYSKACWAVCVFGGLIFFALRGVPALLPDVESSRVTQATTGTGYFRLLAYMAAPASLLLYAARERRAWIYLLISVGLIVGLADRSPLLYILIPIGVTVTVAGQRRFGSAQIILVGLTALLAIAAIGAYRIVSQQDFRDYPEYREDIATKNYLDIAVTSVEHYATIVPKNAVLAKRLVDEGLIPPQYGRSYLTLPISALPGRQLSPDLLIKKASGKTFIGGGTPPTLTGEGYMNFGYAGVVLAALALMVLIRYWGAVVVKKASAGPGLDLRVSTVMYGYVVAWVLGAQVAGFAGASSVPLAGFVLLLVLRHVSATKVTE